MQLRLSDHANKGHEKDEWNAGKILKAYTSGHLFNVERLEGQTADVLFGYTETGECVGLVLSKPKPNDKFQVVVTGFSAESEYWRNT